MKQRVDLALVERGLAQSREKAQAYVLSGRVYVGEVRVDKPSQTISVDEPLVLRGDDMAWASRGALKLEKALSVFAVDAKGVTALDIGAAAGGFTDVLLRAGAKHVYAVDVGYGQMDWRLRQDSRVTVMERTNARTLTLDMFPLRPSLTVMDVSFISIRLLMPVAMQVMGEGGRFVTLIKPQFEAGRGLVGKHGVVREPRTHVAVLKGIRDYAASLGWQMAQADFSPVKGPKGNIEFLADIRKADSPPLDDDRLESLVAQAHQALD